MRLAAARSLAWCLLLSSWVGLGSVLQWRSAGPLGGFALLALWLFALGAAAQGFGRWRLPAVVTRALLLGVAALAALAWTMGTALAIVATSAALLALASAAVRACRNAQASRAAPPVLPATVGAFVALGVIGDMTALNALLPRLAAASLAVGLLLSLLLPAQRGDGRACRAGLFDCALPGAPSGAWRERSRWPLLPAAWAMLPMMCGLPWMVALCRSDALSPPAVLALHFAAMFGPAALLAGRPGLARVAPPLCAVLLALGALALLAAPPAAAWWLLTLAHGGAWSVAWAARLGDAGQRVASPSSALAAAALNALLVLGLGAAFALAGLDALRGWHLALGAAGAAGACALPFSARLLPPRCATAAAPRR